MSAGHTQRRRYAFKPTHIHKGQHTVQTQLIKGVSPLAIDKKVLAITKKNASPWDAGNRYRIAVRNESGTIYRAIECDSLGIYFGLVEGLQGLALGNEVPEDGLVDGFDAIFSLADSDGAAGG